MAIRPNYVHVKPINKLLTPEVALKLRRSVYGGELIIDFDVLVMKDAIHGGVSYPLRFPEAEIELEIPRVSKPPMLGVEREGEHLGRVFGGHWGHWFRTGAKRCWPETGRGQRETKSSPGPANLTDREWGLTKVFEDFPCIRTLPNYPARFGVDYLPGPEKDGRLIGTLAVQLAASEFAVSADPEEGWVNQGTNMVAL